MIKFSSSFGQYKNMAYNFGDLAEVHSNVDGFLKSKGFSSQERLVTATPVHKNKLVILNEDILRGLEGADFPNRSIDADGVITNLPNVPVCFKPADCAVIGFEFSPLERGNSDLSESGCVEDKFFGLLHIGFDDYLKDIVSKFNDFVVGNSHGFDKLTTGGHSLRIDKIHVFPFLQKYRIDYGDFHSDKYDWDNISKLKPFIYDDEMGRFVNFHYAIGEELSRFWKQGIIKFDERDTFSLAKEKRCFSHSLSNFHPEFMNGRNIVVGEIG